jgi:hypothetical protein
MGAILLRPQASRTAGRELLQPGYLVALFLLAVDPAVAEGFVERFGIGDGLPAGALLVEAQSDPGRFCVIRIQPAAPEWGGSEGFGGQFGHEIWRSVMPLSSPFKWGGAGK